MFDPATGLWCFGKNSPSNQAVDPEPYSTKLSSNVKKWIMIEAQDEATCFRPAISDQCCPCGVSLVSNFAINLLLIFGLVYSKGVSLCP